MSVHKFGLALVCVHVCAGVNYGQHSTLKPPGKAYIASLLPVSIFPCLCAPSFLSTLSNGFDGVLASETKRT